MKTEPAAFNIGGERKVLDGAGAPTYMAIYELDYTGIDARAAISEALELADELSTDDSVAFLNGLLGRAAQTRPGRKADGEQ